MSKKKLLAMTLAILVLVMPFSTSAFATDERTPAEGDVAFVPFGDQVYSYPSLEDAIAAVGESEVTIYLAGNDALTKDATIGPNLKVVIATSENYESDTDEGVNVPNGGAKGSAYATLTVPANVTLTINGTLIVAGNQQSAVPRSGFLTGNYGAVQLDGEMVVNGKLYARGEIDGNGTLIANSGSNVYQRFEINDWRGGTASFAAYGNADHSVYPFELYQAAGVNVKAIYKNGSHMVGQSYIYSAQQVVGAVTTVNVIGPNGSQSLIVFDDATDMNASVIMEPDDTGITTITVNGSIDTGDISVSINVFGLNIKLTAEGVGPFGYKTNVVITEGSTFNIDNELKVLPGCTITVESGATLNASGRLYLYTADKYSKTYNNAAWTSTSDAIVEVEAGGNITGNIGSTSTTFANVHGAALTANAPDENVWEVTQSGTSVTFHAIPFTMHLTPAPAE